VVIPPLRLDVEQLDQFGRLVEHLVWPFPEALRDLAEHLGVG
jgi:hypothetical protein